MEKMNDLRDLLKHEVMDLHSAEEQIIKAMPAMIKKVKNPELKQSLQQHLKVTEAQLTRLQKVQKMLDGQQGGTEENGGLLSRLFKRSHTCRGMQGIIDEGEKIMAEDMSPEVMDAAILAASQKIEHYEICGYGTARAFAEELGLTEVASLLEQTLDEEYEADDRLTALAVNRLNERAEKTSRNSTGRTSASTGTNTRESARQRAPREEMDMAMASAKKGAAGTGRNSTQGSGTGRSGNSGNTTGAGATRATKTTAKSSTTRGNNQSTGRGNTSGRS